MPTYPFNDGDTFATFDGIIQRATTEIDQLDNEYVLKASPAELEAHFAQKVSIEPLVLHAEEHYIDSRTSTQIDVSGDRRRAVFPGERATVPGTELKIAVPFEGDAQLWRIRPSTFTYGYPQIDIDRGRILLTFRFPDDTASQASLKEDISRSIKSLSEAVVNQRRDVEGHNQKALHAIQDRLRRKRERATSTLDVVSSLGIPMKRRDAPATYVAPVSRRPAVHTRPIVATERFAPEPVLEETEYQHILAVLGSMSLVIERNPASFTALDEESIRDHFLLQLNGHYDGAATGETFNASGKTDILIRVNGRNVFIAECKFWRGPKGFADTINQLLGYLSWRDCKCAIIMFNRNRDSTAVSQKMHDTMTTHSDWKKTLHRDGNSGGRYVFVRSTDPGREIVVTTMLFDIPAANGVDGSSG